MSKIEGRIDITPLAIAGIREDFIMEKNGRGNPPGEEVTNLSRRMPADSPSEDVVSEGGKANGTARNERYWTALADRQINPRGNGGIESITKVAKKLRAQNALDNPNYGLTLPVYDDKRDIAVGEPVLKVGLDVSIYEPGSESFTALLSTAYGLDNPEFPPIETTRNAIKLNGEREQFQEVQDGDIDEVILFRRAVRERINHDYPASKLDENFFSFLEGTYGIKGKRQLTEFYHTNMTNAVQFYKWYISKVAPQSVNHLSQRNEVDPSPGDPSRLFQLLVSENTSDELKVEIQKILNAFFLSCEFTSRQWEPRLRAKLTGIMAVLDERTFAGQTGEAHNVSIPAWHNVKTGRVIIIPSDPERPLAGGIPDSARLKEHKLKMRKILGTDQRVYLDLDEKGIYSAMAKSVHKANKRSTQGSAGTIHPVRDAVDLSRLVMVVNGDKTQRDELVKRFVADITHTDSYEFVDEIEWVKQDDNTSGKSKAKKYQNRRIQIKFVDLPIPVEVQFFDIQNYLNSKLSVGKKVKGSYDGEATELFDLEKMGELVPLFLPECVYGDLSEQVENTKDRLAEDILERTLEVKAA